MAYGSDINVYVDDQAGQYGAQPSPAPWWLSPDVDILGHSGEAVQGANDVQIRVHAHDEPILEQRIVAEVYVGAPGFVLSPTVGTVRIDNSDLFFRPINFPGTDPVADEPGATRTFQWTPSADTSAINGVGHRCLIVRAFPVDVTPPTAPFDVPNEQHEAQHNIEVLSTEDRDAGMDEGGAGTREDPRRRDKETGMWWERFLTTAREKPGKRYVVWAFDPKPRNQIVAGVRNSLPPKEQFGGFATKPPTEISLHGGEPVDPNELLENKEFAERSGLGTGLFMGRHLLAAAALDLSPDDLSELILRFDHSNLPKRHGLVLHGAQFDEDGTPEGGMTVIALIPS